jgi:hypothetical protein
VSVLGLVDEREHLGCFVVCNWPGWERHVAPGEPAQARFRSVFHIIINPIHKSDQICRLWHGLIRSTARGKQWAALCGTFCMENYDGNAGHFFPRAVLQYMFVW